MRGIPLLLDQLVEILIAKQHGGKAITAGGTTHGGELLQKGFTIGQVVHDYGDVCQATTELAVEHAEPISAEEFQLLNLCLDDAIAAAVTEFARGRELKVAADGRDRATGDLGILSYELGNLVWSAALAFNALQTGSVGVSGTTGAVVARSLDGLRNLVDRAFAVMKLKSQGGTSHRISVDELLEKVKLSMPAVAQGPQLAIEVHDADAVVVADLQILAPIVVQLVLNALQHTDVHGHVVLRSSATAAHVRIEVEDECGGLPPGTAAALFKPLARDAAEESGLGLGLGLSQRGIEAIGGSIAVQDLPGKGCVFTISLPRSNAPSAVRSQKPGRAEPGSAPRR
jgi:signal transduction histidine kinase